MYNVEYMIYICFLYNIWLFILVLICIYIYTQYWYIHEIFSRDIFMGCITVVNWRTTSYREIQWSKQQTLCSPWGISRHIYLINNHGDMMTSKERWAIVMIPGLVNVYKKLWTDPPFLMGKLRKSMAICNSKLLVYQRVPSGYVKIAIENGHL